MKCKNCNNLYNLSGGDNGIVSKWCFKINDCPDIEAERTCDKYVSMTNADRIRDMTDEELSNFLWIVWDEIKDFKYSIEWLQSKSEN